MQYPNFQDAKFADCNGDGVISADDTLALTTNYGFSHPLRQANIIQQNAGKAYLKFNADTIQSGATAVIEMGFDTASFNADSIYGFSFESDYNPVYINSNSFYFNQSLNGWGTYAGYYLSKMSNNISIHQFKIAAVSVNSSKQVSQPVLQFSVQ